MGKRGAHVCRGCNHTRLISLGNRAKKLMSADSINLSSASKHCAGVGLPKSPMLRAPYSNLGQGPCVARGAQQCQECPFSPPRRGPQHMLSFGIPAASLPECTGGKSAVCLFFINLHTHTWGGVHTRTAACQASGKTKLKQALKAGAASLCSLHRWPVPGGLNARWGGCKVIKPTRGEKSKPPPLSMSPGLTGAVNVRISFAVSTQRER